MSVVQEAFRRLALEEGEGYGAIRRKFVRWSPQRRRFEKSFSTLEEGTLPELAIEMKSYAYALGCSVKRRRGLPYFEFDDIERNVTTVYYVIRKRRRPC